MRQTALAVCFAKPKRTPLPGNEATALIMEHLPLVRQLARRVYDRLPSSACVEYGDLVQAGNLGLIAASRSYRCGGPVPFATFARYRIRGEILDSLRKLDGASRSLRRLQKRMDMVQNDLSSSLNREPTEEEVSLKMGVEVGQLRRKKLALRTTSSLAQPRWPGGDGDPLNNAPSVQELPPDEAVARTEIRERLGRAIGGLGERHRKVITMYYTEEMTMKEIGKVMSVNESRVSQIHKCAIETLGRTLRQSGLHSVASC